MTPIRRDFPVIWRHRGSAAAPGRIGKRSWAAPGVAEGEAGWTGLPGLTINRRSRASGPRRAQVAQLVEHATENRSVGGSIPPLGTIALFPSAHPQHDAKAEPNHSRCCGVMAHGEVICG
jgi:hypothetical protein